MSGKKILLLMSVLFVLLMSAIALFTFQEYQRADLGFPDGSELVLSVDEDGAVVLSWPELSGAEQYRVELLDPNRELSEEGSGLIGTVECSENRQVLTGLLPEDAGQVQITVTPRSVYKGLFVERLRDGSGVLRVTADLTVPAVEGLTCIADTQNQSVSIRLDAREDLTYQLCLIRDGEEQVQREFTGGEIELFFGEEGDYPVPEYGVPAEFALRPVRYGEGYIFTGTLSDVITVQRDDLYTRELALEYESLGENRYRFTWNETAGEYYCVQRLTSEGDWETVEEFERGENREYITEALHSGSRVVYRAAAADPDGTLICVSEETEIRADYVTAGCTIWPVRELPLHDPGTMEPMETVVQTGSAYRILEESDGMFLVESGGVQGYIDSRYCMINLPEYLGELCAYDITNSYSSLYRMHDYVIPGITETVIFGYEQVFLSDGRYLVPYLYPCCEKLIAAAEAALEDGFRLKIYDAYRPREATTQLYTTAESILDDPLPGTEDPVTGEETLSVYRDLVTNERYTLANFLARNGSSHNLGIALDLTLETLDGEELTMQTQMHDLSWYSAVDRNNEYANLLSSYMTEAGFHILVSEWWHFQDNETRDALELDYLQDGVLALGQSAAEE